MSSETSEKTPIRTPKARRFDIWVEAKRKGIPNREIAAQLGISERLLDKHIRVWKDDGTFDKYLLCEWLIVYDALNEKDDLKTTFQALTQMLMKRMKEQSEIELKGLPKVVVEIIDNSKNPVPPSSATT